jgi:alpha,alpha-trehalase
MKYFSRITAAIDASASVDNELYVNGSVTAPCDSPLYCQGEVLKGIELAHPFSDSKTYVDMWVSSGVSMPMWTARANC